MLSLKSVQEAYNLAENSHNNSILDYNQGLPCDILPMDAALSEIGFSDNEIILIEAADSTISALAQIVQGRIGFYQLVDSIASKKTGLDRVEIRHHVKSNADIAIHNFYSDELLAYCLDFYFN